MGTHPNQRKKTSPLFTQRKWYIPVLLFLLCFPSVASEKVLVVNSYHKGYPWSDRIIEGIRHSLRDLDVELKVVYMDSKRNPDEASKKLAGLQAMEYFEAFDPDYVIATDDNAQAYFARHLVGRQRPQVVFAGRHTRAVFQELSFNNWRLALAKTTAYSDESRPDASVTLEELSTGLQARLNEMDKQLSEAVSRFQQEFPEEDLTRKVFRELYNNIPYAYSFALIDKDGIMTIMEPAAFYPSQGSDISHQSSFQKVLNTKKPLLSPAFTTVEGFSAIAVYHPVLNKEGELAGIVSMLIRPEHMAASQFLPLIVKTHFHPWLIQSDGLVLFDQYLQAAATNILTNPSWQHAKELHELIQQMQTQKSGTKEYLLLNQQLQEIVMQQAWWSTIELHGQEWKVILSSDPF